MHNCTVITRLELVQPVTTKVTDIEDTLSSANTVNAKWQYGTTSNFKSKYTYQTMRKSISEQTLVI